MAEDYLTVEHEKPFKYEEGGLNVTRGCAWTGPGCHLGCGVLMYTNDEGTLVKCEGDPEDPWTNGRLCMRCIDVPEVTNHKERYDHPDYEVPEVMFVWGNYPLKSNIEGFYGHWVIDLMKRGMKLVTWIPEEKIIAAARMLGKAKNATLQWGVAVDMTREAMPAGQAILTLWEITGNMERPGGMIVAPEILSVAGGWGREVLGEEQERKRIGIQDYPLFNFGFAVSQPDETVKTIETGIPYEIKGAWLQTTNPIACMGADPQRLYKALNKLDFIVVVDIFKTPMIAALADVVLVKCPPACSIASHCA